MYEESHTNTKREVLPSMWGIVEILHDLRQRGYGVTINRHLDTDDNEVLVWNGDVFPIARANESTLLGALMKVHDDLC